MSPFHHYRAQVYRDAFSGLQAFISPPSRRAGRQSAQQHSPDDFDAQFSPLGRILTGRRCHHFFQAPSCLSLLESTSCMATAKIKLMKARVIPFLMSPPRCAKRRLFPPSPHTSSRLSLSARAGASPHNDIVAMVTTCAYHTLTHALYFDYHQAHFHFIPSSASTLAFRPSDHASALLVTRADYHRMSIIPLPLRPRQSFLLFIICHHYRHFR